MDRHTSTEIARRESVRRSIADDGDNGEDFAMAAMADGYRPSDQGHIRQSLQPQHPYRSLQAAPIPPPRPSSTSKPKYDSFALRHDGAMGSVAVRTAAVASSSYGLPSRSSSVSTDLPWRAESPYQGPTGASRNYGMYPQNTVPENASMHDESLATPIPVGFPGTNFHTSAPEGDTADIVGPHGYTEQLPPYTKYPDEALARQTRPMVQVPLSGAGGIGLATRNPEFASREDLPSPGVSSQSLSLAESGTTINSATAVVSEKPPLKSWQKFAKRKICGIIPAWALFLTATILIIFAIVLGSLFAVFRPRHRKHHLDGDDGYAQSIVPQPATMTTTFDANSLTTVPTGLPSLPTGTYLLPITVPATAPDGCLQDTAQSAAWSCQIQPALSYQLNVDAIPNSPPTSDNEITLNYASDNISFLPYGAQPPIMTQAHVMTLVTDSQDPGRGPAWFFQTFYDKIVVVPENALSASSNTKRQSEDLSTSSFTGRRGTAQAGQNPWICYWNGTLLEAFIYVNQTSSWGARSSSSSSSSLTPTTTATYPLSAQTSGAEVSSYADPTFVPGYPKVIKVQERRMPKEYVTTVSPYCVQQTVAGNGTVSPLLNSTGQPIMIYLNETEPSAVSPISDRSIVFERLEERARYLQERDSISECGCVWLST